MFGLSAVPSSASRLVTLAHPEKANDAVPKPIAFKKSLRLKSLSIMDSFPIKQQAVMM